MASGRRQSTVSRPYTPSAFQPAKIFLTRGAQSPGYYLTALVSEALKVDPYGDNVFVFRKLLSWDGSDTVLVTKWLLIRSQRRTPLAPP